MSQENVDVVRRCYSSWGDLALLRDTMDPEVVLDFSRNVFNPGMYRGHDGVRRYLGDVEEAWEDFRVRPDEFIDGGDKVVTSVHISGRGHGSGVPVDMHLFNVWECSEGKVLRVTGGYRNREEALEAAGLPE
jgi:ketosteroid isomerase-like protein